MVAGLKDGLAAERLTTLACTLPWRISAKVSMADVKSPAVEAGSRWKLLTIKSRQNHFKIAVCLV